MKVFIVFSVVLLGFIATEATVVGGITDADPNDLEVKKALEFAETMMDRAVNSLFTHKIGKVLKVQSQVVSGTKYYLNFEFSETTCLKNTPQNGVTCDITKTEICSAQVWSRPWLAVNKMEILSFNCKSDA